jgi:hypothetical protein
MVGVRGGGWPKWRVEGAVGRESTEGQGRERKRGTVGQRGSAVDGDWDEDARRDGWDGESGMAAAREGGSAREGSEKVRARENK